MTGRFGLPSVAVLTLLAGCAQMKPPPSEPARQPAPTAAKPEAPGPAASKKGTKPLPIPARPLQAKASCSYRDDVGTEGRLQLEVKNSKVERFASTVDMGAKGRCMFDLSTFRQTGFGHVPTLESGSCTVSMWEQKDEVTVSYRNCAAHCTPGAHDYLWPTLVSRKTGSCR